jgi:hypothetical protein
MKRLVALTVVLMFSACAQSGNPDPNPEPNPDPIITTPINSRFVGKVSASATGAGQDAAYEFDSIFEFREKTAGRLIGYSQMRDKLQNGKLIVDYWAQGQRSNADVTLYLSLNSSCDDLKLQGKLDLSGNITFPKIVQRLGCGFFASISVTTEATMMTRQGDPAWPWWKKVEDHFTSK